jgi:hypothetical protein
MHSSVGAAVILGLRAPTKIVKINCACKEKWKITTELSL